VIIIKKISIKVIASVMILSLLMCNTVMASTYNLSNTKVIETKSMLSIKEAEQKKLSDLIISGNLANNEERVYAQNYAFSYDSKNITIKDADKKNNYTFNINNSVSKNSDFLGGNNDLSYNMSFKTKVSFIKYNVDVNSLNINPQYKDEIKPYLLPSENIQSDNPLIISKANEIVGEEKNPYKKAQMIYNFTYMYLTYDLNNGNKSALSALNTKRGVCEDYAELMVALLRSQNIPARTVSGYKVGSNLKDIDISSHEYNHMWVEFYIDGYGWIPSDPTITYLQNGVKIITDITFAQLNDFYYIPLTIDAPIGIAFKYAMKNNDRGQINPSFNVDSKVNDYTIGQETKKSIKLFLNSKNALTDGVPFNLDATPYLKNEKTMVPLRFISENLNTKVNWNEEQQQVTINNGKDTIILTIGNSNASVNGTLITLEASPELKDGRTMVPIRFVSENLKANVSWDNNTQSILITSN
jgi:hypothetical protein